MGDKLVKSLAMLTIGGCVIKTIKTVKLRKLEKEIEQQIEENRE